MSLDSFLWDQRKEEETESKQFLVHLHRFFFVCVCYSFCCPVLFSCFSYSWCNIFILYCIAFLLLCSLYFVRGRKRRKRGKKKEKGKWLPLLFPWMLSLLFKPLEVQRRRFVVNSLLRLKMSFDVSVILPFLAFLSLCSCSVMNMEEEYFDMKENEME